jgi:hypothetical protein
MADFGQMPLRGLSSHFRLFHVAYDGVAIVIGKQIPKPDRLLSRTTNFKREHCPGNSKLAEQNQDQHDNEYEAEAAATVVAGAVEGAAAEPAKAPE